MMFDFSRPGIHRHVVAYASGVALMVGINLLTSPDVWWAQWPALGWGIGLVSHATASLLRRSPYSPDEASVRAARPQIALPDEPDAATIATARSESDAMVERAEALLRRERAGG